MHTRRTREIPAVPLRVRGPDEHPRIFTKKRKDASLASMIKMMAGELAAMGVPAAVGVEFETNMLDTHRSRYRVAELDARGLARVELVERDVDDARRSLMMFVKFAKG